MMIATPLLGTWGASSIAAYAGGPTWAALLAGLVLFPVGPLSWDGLSEFRRRRRQDGTQRILTFTDRLILRTLVLNGLFLAALFSLQPQRLFTALSARGDWMLDSVQSSQARWARGQLFSMADHVEWLYLWSQDNPYEIEEPNPAGADPDGGVAPAGQLGVRLAGDAGVSSDPLPSSDAAVELPPDAGTAPATGDAGSTEFVEGLDGGSAALPSDAGTQPVDEPDVQQAPQARDWAAKLAWPLPSRLHPAVVSMPEATKQSLPAIAAYIQQQEPNPYLQVKAIHDYVADRVHYDFQTLDAGGYPPYDAETVNRTASGVCAGYAMLFKALAEHAGYETHYVTGKVRDELGMFDGSSHAWNAVRVEQRWFLLDVTWDSEHAARKHGVRGTEYLFTPPSVFGMDHFPKEERWQLLDDPLTRGEFIRQPILTPRFYAQRLTLVDPRRSHLDVQGRVQVRLANPSRKYLLASVEDEHGLRHDCGDVTDARDAMIACRLPHEGIFRLLMFSNAERSGSYRYVGRFAISSRH